MLKYDKQVYSQQELAELHDKSLKMAQYFVDFCKEHDLLCYFCGGGCIGTIRHQGFIPWDDDLDFFMPRSDYEKLEELWHKYADEGRYKITRPGKDYIDHNCFITIKDVNTTFIKPYQKDLDICHGLPLDIFPLDGYPKSKFKRMMQKNYALFYSLFCTQVIPSKHGKLKKFISKFLLTIVPTKTLKYYLWKFCEKRMSRFKIDDCESITELCAGPYYMQKKYPSEAFKSNVYKKYENTMMPIPIGYDIYLKTAFGDYMKMPPKEKQFAHHEVEFMDLDNSYLNYRGIKYLNK